MTDFYINSRENAEYPSAVHSYNPDSCYPEYMWGKSEVSPERNLIYEMVRDSLAGLKMDAANFNKKEWNPFGDIIREGDTVVIKPNWVMHYNKNKEVTDNSLECLITHPSVVRAVIDYCLIALKGTGKLIIGDAPMQGCDLGKLLESSGYNDMFSFFHRHETDLNPVDFREYSTVVDHHKVLLGRKYNSGEALKVELDENSRLKPGKISTYKYRVSDYSEKVTNSFHNNGKHVYLINKEVLQADVIINMPKPKCHRLAGITGAVKNIVGITFDKACLPHRTEGSVQEGGDEYLHTSGIKKLTTRILDLKLHFEEKKNYRLSLMMRYLYGFLYYLIKYTGKDKYLIGSWFGNDTVWRTALDLYHILLYADKNGKVQTSRQRIVFNISDMIISGERNGPVAPEPKKLGVLVAGSDGIMMDRLICEIMGFNYIKVPIIYNAGNLMGKDKNDFKFHSNLPAFDGKKIDELKFPESWRFKPYDTWKGVIEKY
jgi:uncharacterized protein (DUF362 family)